MAAIFKDTFTGSSGTLLTAHTPDFGSYAWSNLVGSMAINANGQATSSNGSDSASYVDLGLADCVITTTWISYPIPPSYYQRNYFRIIDSNNFLRIDYNGQIRLLKVVNGTTTQIGISSSVSRTNQANGGKDTVKITLNGSQITVNYNGVDVITITDTTHQTATKHGISSYNTSACFDDIQIDSLGTTPTGTDVSYSYGMKQVIYADRTVQAPTKQAIYTNRSNSVPTVQNIYANRQYQFPIKQAFYAEKSYDFPTKQVLFSDRTFSFALEQRLYSDIQATFPTAQRIYADRSWDYPLQQTIFSDYVLYSASFPLKIIVYKDVEKAFPTEQRLFTETSANYPMKQAIYKPVSAQAPTKQIIYADVVQAVPLKQVIWADRTYTYPLTIAIFDPDKSIINVVTLKGQRDLYAYLQGTRDLYVILKGGIPLLHGQDLSLVSGDSLYADFTLTNKDGTPLDLTGATIKYLAHQYGTPKITKGADTGGLAITDATNGVVRITFDPADTASLLGEYSHEMQVMDSQGHVSTVMSGKLTIEKGYIQ